MKITRLTQEEDGWWSIVIVNVDEAVLTRLLGIVRKLGLARDPRAERRASKWGARVPVNRFVDSKIYGNRTSHFTYLHHRQYRYLVVLWKSPIVDGEALASLFLSTPR